MRSKPIVRVLMVEDFETDAQLVRRELVRGGINVELQRVEREEDFRRALELFVPHVILSDFRMPGFDGLAALAIARAAAPGVPFIFVSGTFGEEAATSARREGVRDYVLKSDLPSLPPAVRRALG